MDINQVTILGNVGRDPDIKTFSNGDKVANLSIATKETWKKQDGTKGEKTEWHNVTVRHKGGVTVCERYVKKGSRIWIVGQLATRKWQDKDGNDRYTTEIIVPPFWGRIGLESGTKPDSDSQQRFNDRYDEATADMDDEIPF